MNTFPSVSVTAFITILSSGFTPTEIPVTIRLSFRCRFRRGNKFKSIIQTDRIEYGFNIVITVISPACYPQSKIDFSFWKNYHYAVFNVKIPYRFEFFVIDFFITLSTSFKHCFVCNNKLIFLTWNYGISYL